MRRKAMRRLALRRFMGASTLGASTLTLSRSKGAMWHRRSKKARARQHPSRTVQYRRMPWRAGAVRSWSKVGS